MSRCALTVARLALPAWVGAATLFVINGVQQITFPGFDSIVRNQLALLRFPAYYALGFTLVACGFVGTLLARDPSQLSPRRRRLAAALLAAALIVMLLDYRFVYSPLAAMLSPPDAPRPQNFTTYHRASEAVNTLHVGLVLCAAVVLCLPARHCASATSR